MAEIYTDVASIEFQVEFKGQKVSGPFEYFSAAKADLAKRVGDNDPADWNIVCTVIWHAKR